MESFQSPRFCQMSPLTAPGATTPAARRQLDFVFASTRIAEAVTTTALNTPESWGPSDHCRVRIDVNERPLRGIAR